MTTTPPAPSSRKYLDGSRSRLTLRAMARFSHCVFFKPSHYDGLDRTIGPLLFDCSTASVGAIPSTTIVFAPATLNQWRKTKDGAAKSSLVDLTHSGFHQRRNRKLFNWYHSFSIDYLFEIRHSHCAISHR